MQYLGTREKEVAYITDVDQASSFQEKLSSGSMASLRHEKCAFATGGFNLVNDFFFSSSCDGVRLYKKDSIWFIVLVTWNLPPDVRTKNDSLLLWAILPQGVSCCCVQLLGNRCMQLLTVAHAVRWLGATAVCASNCCVCNCCPCPTAVQLLCNCCVSN